MGVVVDDGVEDEAAITRASKVAKSIEGIWDFLIVVVMVGEVVVGGEGGEVVWITEEGVDVGN